MDTGQITKHKISRPGLLFGHPGFGEVSVAKGREKEKGDVENGTFKVTRLDWAT